MNMDLAPIDGLNELEKHLSDLKQTPETPLQPKLFDDVELQLTPVNIQPLIPRLLPILTEVLASTPHEPSPITSLTIKLLQPLKWTDILQLASEESLDQALSSPAPSAALLAFTCIAKATRSPSDVGILSTMQDLVATLVRVWFSNPSVEVGEKATNTLAELLEEDCDVKQSGSGPKVLNVDFSGGQLNVKEEGKGQGLLWRRILDDQDVYASIYELCSNKTMGTSEGQLDERQKSLAQARLLRILPRLAKLNLDALMRSRFPDVEEKYGAEKGLLWFACCSMVDKSDLLMHITLLDFFAELLATLCEVHITPSQMQYLSALMQEVCRNDEKMYKSLEALAIHEETSPELVSLLLRLNQGSQSLPLR